MDNVYSLFYTGQQNPYGIGTWDSKRRKLKNSSSQPYLTSNSKNLPHILSEQNRKNTQYSRDREDLHLPLIHTNHNYKDKLRRYKTINSSESGSSYRYDTNANRKELSNFVKDINNSIAVRLQNDNLIAQQKLNNIKNNYNEIKTLLNNKIEKLEQDQQMQFDNLKLALEKGGGLKMMGAVKNANGGNNFDLQRAEEEDMIDATRKLPRLLEEKINLLNNMKIQEKQDEKRLLSQARRKLNDELKKQKEKDEIRFKKEIDEIEQKRERIRQERKRLIEELNNDFEDSESNTIYSNSQSGPAPSPPPLMYPPQMMPQYPYQQPMFIPPPIHTNNNNGDSTSEFLKIFLLKKLFDDKPHQTVQNPPMPQFMPFGQNQYQYPPMMYQNPQQPNMMYPGQPPYNNMSGTDGCIPFIDPLEDYLEQTKSQKKTTRTKSSRGKSKKSEKTEESTTPAIKLKKSEEDKTKSKSKKEDKKKESEKKKKGKKEEEDQDDEENDEEGEEIEDDKDEEGEGGEGDEGGDEGGEEDDEEGK